ncbi:unnamed protein product [Caenorhabditis sp. 36 PRJEB53466]|nr:unnamed protein product [Caenorhabditis sp. 36 PRJEB53466]
MLRAPLFLNIAAILQLIMLTPETSMTQYQKMVVVWGQPVEFTGYSDGGTWADCLATCYETLECVLVYNASTGCQMFMFGNLTLVEQLDSSAQEKVAFKTNFTSDTCPDTLPTLGENSTAPAYIINQTIYISSISSDGLYWSFNFTTITCTNTSKPFIRGLHGVCLQVFFATVNYTQAIELCASNDGMSLSGPYNSDEVTWIRAQTTVYTWLDGSSFTGAQEWSYEDDTHNGSVAYPFASGNPDSSKAGFCFYINYYVNQVDDDACSARYSGAVCRMVPQSIEEIGPY